MATPARKWNLSDVLIRKNGEQFVTILKLSHPTRQQRLTIVPTPRYATKTFYNAWVYQTYARDHQLRMSDDIYTPFHVPIARTLMGKRFDKYPALSYFRLVDMPDCIENNITRREFVARERLFKSSMWRKTTTPAWRDKRVGWVAREVHRQVGERYLGHPHPKDQSHVWLLVPAQVPAAVNALVALGFTVDDKRVECIGPEADLDKLDRYASIANGCILSYCLLLLSIFVVNESYRLYKAYFAYLDEVREIIEKQKRRQEAERESYS